MPNVNWLYAKVMSDHRDAMTERVVKLFWFETQGRRDPPIVSKKDFSKRLDQRVDPARFATWLNRKSFALTENLLGRTWLKEDDSERCFVLHFRPNGEVVESEAGKLNVKWRGIWKLSGGVLRLYISDFVSDYLATGKSRLTGVEQQGGWGGTSSFFKLTRLN